MDEHTLDVRSPIAVSAKRVLSPAARERVRRFINAAVPGGAAAMGRRYNYREVKAGPDADYKGGSRLDEIALDKHLSGSWIVSPRWPERVDAIEIDLDAKDDASRGTVLGRLYDVIGALDARPLPPRPMSVGNFIPWDAWGADAAWLSVPGIVWQTGPTGGLRYRLLLDGLHDRAELRDRTLEALARRGLEAKGGSIEVWPDGERSLRAPLAYGFRFLDGEGHPLCEDSPAVLVGYSMREGKDGSASRVRSVEAMLSTWEAMVTARRLPLEAFFGSPPVISLPGSFPEATSTTSTRTATGTPVTAPVRSPISRRKEGGGGPSGFDLRAQAWTEHGAGPGERDEAAAAVRWYWFARLGMDAEEVLRRFRGWLEHAPHSSRDLSGSDSGLVKASMMKSARADLRRMGSRVTNRASRNAPTPLLPSGDRGPNSDRRWKAEILAGLCPDDRALLASAPEERWLKEALAVLLTRLRAHQVAHPAVTAVAIPKVQLLEMATHNMRTDPTTGEVRASYRILLDAAQGLGLLGPVVQRFSKRDRRANTFALGPAVAWEPRVAVEVQQFDHSDVTEARTAS